MTNVQTNMSRGKTLIAFIGAGSAIETEYALFESQADGEYVLIKENEKQPAAKQYGYPFLAKLVEETFDQVVFLGTKGSKWGMLRDKIASMAADDSKDQQKPVEESDELLGEYLADDRKSDLKEELSNNISGYISKIRALDYDIKVEIILIKEGRTETENKENIENIQNALSKLDISEITLDVTNGLRSHPMYVLPIINNIAAIYNKNIPINIYYGMYDGKVEEREENSGVYKPSRVIGNGIAPMVDLKEIRVIDKWTGAVREFCSNGSVLQILELLEESAPYFVEDSERKNYKAYYLDAFNAFSFAINSNNLDMLQGAVAKIYNLVDGENGLVGVSDEMPVYVQNSLIQIVSYIKKQFVSDHGEQSTQYASLMLSLANWYLRQNRLGDSVRTFQEAVITYVMEMYPGKTFRLLESRLVKWEKEEDKTEEECISGHLFDANVRRVIRKELFEDETVLENRDEELEKWQNWKKEYDYMKQYVHNPDALLYNGSTVETGEANIKEAKKSITDFAVKIDEERRKYQSRRTGDMSKPQLESRIDYLLDVKHYDVFISYRRSYYEVDKKKINDGVLLTTSICDYLESKGLNVFIDKRELVGTEGEFEPYIHNSLIKSKIFLLILGNQAYCRDYSDQDQYYKEIIMAVQRNKKIAVVCMNDFYKPDGLIDLGRGVEDHEELMKVVNDYQRIGAEYSATWEYDNILSLRNCIYKELSEMLKK